jgi:hypothetical protein
MLPTLIGQIGPKCLKGLHKLGNRHSWKAQLSRTRSQPIRMLQWKSKDLSALGDCGEFRSRAHVYYLCPFPHRQISQNLPQFVRNIVCLLCTLYSRPYFKWISRHGRQLNGVLPGFQLGSLLQGPNTQLFQFPAIIARPSLFIHLNAKGWTPSSVPPVY